MSTTPSENTMSENTMSENTVIETRKVNIVYADPKKPHAIL